MDTRRVQRGRGQLGSTARARLGTGGGSGSGSGIGIGFGARIGLGALLVVMMIGAGSASAGLQRVEAVGNYGIREGSRSQVIPRDEAVQKALWEGVSRVALELMGEEAVDGGDEDQASRLREALGADMLPYTRRFRILQDKGEMPVLFEEDPGVSVEYVVVVEVLVDVDRVTGALAGAGLVANSGGSEGREPVFVELLGVSAYPGFEAIRKVFRDELGATRVDTLGFAQGRQLLSVEGPFGPEELSAALGRLDVEDRGVVLEPVDLDAMGRRVRVQGRWRP